LPQQSALGRRQLLTALSLRLLSHNRWLQLFAGSEPAFFDLRFPQRAWALTRFLNPLLIHNNLRFTGNLLLLRDAYSFACYHPDMASRAKPRPLVLPNGADLAYDPSLHMGKVQAMFATPSSFVSMCQIVREDESTGYLNPTPTQLKLIQAVHDHRWVLVNKFRQAKITTISVMLLLRDCMYLSGVKGLLIAERQDTAEDIFERILFAYHRLPDDVRVPLAAGRKAGSTQMHFCHGGGIKVLTAGGRSPAIGRSIDRLIITEFGEAQWQRKAAINIFPTVNKRPNARIILESTPGRGGSHHEQMWHSALEGKSRFHPLFLKWWQDESCQIETKGGFTPTEEERDYLSRHEGLSANGLAFRRSALNTEFVGDERLFSSKYPSDPYDGWLGAYAPIMPLEILKPMLAGAVTDPPLNRFSCREIEPPAPDGRYIVTADPAGFGGTGDQSALTVWDAINRREVGFWEDREDPTRFAARLMNVQRRYNNALLVVESNAMACIAVLKDKRCRNLLWTSRNHPGWYATEKRIQEAEARLVQLLRDEEITIRSRGTLHQLMNYDGSRKKRVKGLDGITHHFDRARTAIMAADVLSRRNFTRAVLERSNEYETGRVTIRDLDKFSSHKRAESRSPFKPPPRTWS
tara:strand:+ start:197 stop:2101 length:1905 start_codon:yes stop_codon:yes gene_type:complete